MTTKEALNAAWTVLVEECGAHEDGRADFVAFTEAHGLTEYRFGGSLGFGGKLRYDPHRTRLYVDCYREHETPERAAQIAATNVRLELVRSGWTS